MPAKRNQWTREQLVVTLDLYCRLPDEDTGRYPGRKLDDPLHRNEHKNDKSESLS